MKKWLIIGCVLLIGAVTQTDVKIKKLTDEIERIKQHLKTGQISLPVGGKIIWGDGDTNIKETSDDLISMTLNDVELFKWSSAYFRPTSDGVVDLGTSASDDWETIYYHNLSQDSGRDGKSNITDVSTTTLCGNELPLPKTYERRSNLGVIEYGLIAEDCPEELIKYDKDGKPMIQTNALISYLCGVVKIQGEEIEKLKQR